MKVLFDTNTLVAALVETHPHHPRAWPWLIRAKQKDIIGLMERIHWRRFTRP